MITVKSMTSGLPLYAEKIKESPLREFFGLPCVQLSVDCTSLRGGRFKSVIWYRRNEITILDEPDRCGVVPFKK